MTHTSIEKERAEFEAIASDNGEWPQAIERDSKGDYVLMHTAQGWRWWKEAWEASRLSLVAMNSTKLKDSEAKIGELLALARVMVSKAIDASSKAEMPEVKAAIESEVAFERALRVAMISC